MTRYEIGFLTKCASHGVTGGKAVSLMRKLADARTYVSNYGIPVLGGVLGGAAIGALTGRGRRRWGRAALMALLGGTAAAGARYLGSGGTINDLSGLQDSMRWYSDERLPNAPMFSDLRGDAGATRTELRDMADAFRSYDPTMET